jgi:Phosphoglycerate dehydrogenase and related dehydrogenases
MKKPVLVLADVNRELLQKSLPDMRFEYMGYAENNIVLDHQVLHDIIAPYEIVISEFDTFDQYVLDAAVNLKLLVCCRGGVQTVVDLDYAEKKGVTVRNTPGRNAHAVAEYVIGQLIAADRYLYETNVLEHEDVLQNKTYYLPKEYKDSLWGMDSSSPYHVFRGRGLQNITLGIVGFGRVGKVVAEKAKILGIHVVVYDHSKQEYDPEYNYSSFEELLIESDIVSLHCSNKKHQVVMGKKEFAMMKDGSTFINTARGDLVDEEALIESLNSGHLKKAVLDVTRNEPLKPKDPLIFAKNLMLTPHIAGATDIVIDNGTRMAVEHIKTYLKMDYEYDRK